MENTQLPQDFKDFLKLLNENDVHYLLIGGYAVGYYGYPRATHDMDIWIAVDPENAKRMVDVMTGFGFAEGAIAKEVFLQSEGVVRMGVPPLRLEILMSISGVAFKDCYERGLTDDIDGVPVRIIHLKDLLENKIASGRHKDLDDVSNLPKEWPEIQL
jgi:predicted nucleotidyltransferase